MIPRTWKIKQITKKWCYIQFTYGGWYMDFLSLHEKGRHTLRWMAENWLPSKLSPHSFIYLRTRMQQLQYTRALRKFRFFTLCLNASKVTESVHWSYGSNGNKSDQTRVSLLLTIHHGSDFKCTIHHYLRRPHWIPQHRNRSTEYQIPTKNRPVGGRGETFMCQEVQLQQFHDKNK